MSKTDRIRAKIAANRDRALFRLAARASEKYLRAYNNQLNWDVNVNGEAAALRKIARATEGDIFDVGANDGRWAAMALSLIGDKKIHCFEAIPATFRSLAQRVGSHANVTLNNVGLGAAEDRIEIYFYPDSSDRTSAYDLADGFRKEKVSVPIVRGDAYVTTHGIEQISFLKIDVEGMEMDVLRGFEASLRTGVVKAIQFEHGPAHVLSRHFLRDFLEYLKQFDYTLFRCYPNALRELKYDIESDENFTGENFVAVRREISAACRL